MQTGSAVLTLNVNIGPELGWTLNGYERGNLNTFNVNGVNIDIYSVDWLIDCRLDDIDWLIGQNKYL